MDEFNTGGTPHTEAEIQRVRELLEIEQHYIFKEVGYGQAANRA